MMTTQTISFRISTEAYLKLEAVAANFGLSPGVYLRKKLEDEQDNLSKDIQIIQADIKEILNSLSNFDNHSSNSNIVGNDSSYALLLETLLILRETAQPNNVSNAQKKLKSIGLNPFNILEQ